VVGDPLPGLAKQVNELLLRLLAVHRHRTSSESAKSQCAACLDHGPSCRQECFRCNSAILAGVRLAVLMRSVAE
jgi:hypothetical protein